MSKRKSPSKSASVISHRGLPLATPYTLTPYQRYLKYYAQRKVLLNRMDSVTPSRLKRKIQPVYVKKTNTKRSALGTYTATSTQRSAERFERCLNAKAARRHQYFKSKSRGHATIRPIHKRKHRC